MNVRVPPLRQVPTLTQVLERPMSQILAPSLPDAAPAETPGQGAGSRAQITRALRLRIDELIVERLSSELDPLVGAWLEEFSARVQHQVRQTLSEVVQQAVDQALREQGQPPSQAVD